MIRKATNEDISAVAALYERAIDYEDTHVKYTSWKKGIYPTADTAKLGVKNQSLYVLELDAKILGAVILDNRQPPEYKNVPWASELKYNEVLVIHTLCVDPLHVGTGIGTALVDFAKQLARECECKAIRLNTTHRNLIATRLYLKSGFYVTSKKEILLNGQIRCGEHLFMEYVIS